MCDRNFHFSTKSNPTTPMTHLQATKIMTVMEWAAPSQMWLFITETVEKKAFWKWVY